MSSPMPTPGKVVIVTGSRNWIDKSIIRMAIIQAGKISLLVHGGCRGADVIAGEVASSLGISVIACQANWRLYGKSAGRIRNAQMLNDYKPDLILAFPLPSSVGTHHMMGIAGMHKIEIRTYGLKGVVR